RCGKRSRGSRDREPRLRACRRPRSRYDAAGACRGARRYGGGPDMSGETRSAHTVSDFDARAATWDGDPTKVERARAIADAILREVPPRPAIAALEYGAGTGLLGFMLRDRIGELTLADISDGMLEVAQRKIAALGDSRVRAVKLDLLMDK